MNIKNIFIAAKNKLLKKDNNREKIHSIDDMLALQTRTGNHLRKIHHVDLSELDLSESKHMFISDIPDPYMSPDEAAKQNIIMAWTDDVVWPDADKMPPDFDPNKIINDNKYPTELTTAHERGQTGKNIGIAILDQCLNTTHPEYADRIKHYEVINGYAPKQSTEYHGSLVAGCAVGRTTGTAPDADLYYFAASPRRDEHDPDHRSTRKYINIALRKILELNKTLPADKKIRFISCSWGSRSDLLSEETNQLFAECERQGIMVIGGAYKKNIFAPIDKNYPPKQAERIGIPTNGKTTPFWDGGYYYTRQGGMSSTFPYLAGVFACALQGNTIFCTRPNWQDELMDIMKRTAIDHEHGGKIINPTSIVDTVTQIAREMEMNLMKQQATQHE